MLFHFKSLYYDIFRSALFLLYTMKYNINMFKHSKYVKNQKVLKIVIINYYIFYSLTVIKKKKLTIYISK